jgi:hypothetical protein
MLEFILGLKFKHAFDHADNCSLIVTDEAIGAVIVSRVYGIDHDKIAQEIIKRWNQHEVAK